MRRFLNILHAVRFAFLNLHIAVLVVSLTFYTVVRVAFVTFYMLYTWLSKRYTVQYWYASLLNITQFGTVCVAFFCLQQYLYTNFCS